jgi:hypothetical protein
MLVRTKSTVVRTDPKKTNKLQPIKSCLQLNASGLRAHPHKWIGVHFVAYSKLDFIVFVRKVNTYSTTYAKLI